MLLVSCQGGNKKYSYYQDQGEIFSTGYHIKYAYHRSLKEEIVAELNRFDLSLNPFLENSIITKVNRNEPVKPDSLFTNVFRKSMEGIPEIGRQIRYYRLPTHQCLGIRIPKYGQRHAGNHRQPERVCRL